MATGCAEILGILPPKTTDALRSMKQVAGRTLAALAMAAGLSGALATAPATADSQSVLSNGVEVTVCVQPGHYDIRAAIINGWNQNDNYVASPELFLDGDRRQQRCHKLREWWWKGTIDVDFWADNGDKLGTRTCDVPADKPFPVHTCYFD
ncbi:hypothetical protein AB0392_41615 [Nonomuraea angiospora]|uniref:hypothetical protein n=1 Tax=Nonomuraea angiospora TaxID=46172 RepID=UPI00344D209F